MLAIPGVENLDEAKEVAGTVDHFHELSFQFPGVRADSQIATVLAVRESAFVQCSVALPISLPRVVVYTRVGPKKSQARRPTKSSSLPLPGQFVIVAIFRPHGPIRDEYCHDMEYCEQQQTANLVSHGDSPCFVDNVQGFSIPHGVSVLRLYLEPILANASGDFEQPGCAHAAANAHGYDDVFDFAPLAFDQGVPDHA